MLVVGTQAVPVASCEASSRRSASGHAATGGRSASHAIPAACRWASAIRRGWRTAASPPGSDTGARWPTRVKRWLSGPSSRISPPQIVAVRSVAGAVERHPDDRLPQPPVLREQRNDVRVVVLHEVHRPVPGVALGPLPRQVGGVQVGGQPDGHPAQGGELPGGPLERPQRLQRAHVADVRRDVREPAVGEAERVLQLPADGEHRLPAHPEVDRQRREPPGAADRQLVPVHHADHGVVARHVDRAVVVEHGVGKRGQPFRGVGGGEADGLVGAVGAGHHEHAAVGQQQVVHRRVRQQHPQPRVVRGDGLGERGPGRLRSNTTGRAGEVSTAASASSISASARAASRSRTITANGLPPRALRARTVATAASDVATQARW